MAEFWIRPARPPDGERLEAALAQWLPADRARLLTPGIPGEAAAGACFVAESGSGGLAGFVETIVAPDSPGVGYVHFIWVSPDYRMQGLGRGLYRRALRGLRARGCRCAAAVVSRDSPGAIAFHEHLGFRPSDDTGLAVEVPATGGQGVVYVLAI